MLLLEYRDGKSVTTFPARVPLVLACQDGRVLLLEYRDGKSVTTFPAGVPLVLAPASWRPKPPVWAGAL